MLQFKSETMPFEDEADFMSNPDRLSDFVMVTFQFINTQLFVMLVAALKNMGKEKNTVDGLSNWGREE